MAKEIKEAKTKKRTVAKKPILKKKVKPVIIDVIEDEPLVKEVEETAPLTRFYEEEKIQPVRTEEIDQQKKFFSDLVSEIKEKKPKSKKKEINSHRKDLNEETTSGQKNIGLYRRLIWKFVILVLILVAIVAYFSFSTLTVVITPKGEILSDNLFFKVSKDGNLLNSDSSDPREAISGQSREVTASVEKKYPATGEEFIGEEIIGNVKIINNYNKNQALVATTRLLSPDNKLFRIKNAVNVPAGGEVNVDIYVDKPAADLAISPTTFVIPGLWLGIQDKIFARSDQEFVFQQKIKKIIKQADIERATKDINDLLIKTAKADKELTGQAESDWLYDTSNQTTLEIDAKAGEAKDEFMVKARGKIVAVAFSKEEVAKLAAAKLNLLVPDDKELIDFKSTDIVYSLENYDSATGNATIKASFTGTMALKNDSEIINRNKLVNLTATQINDYLKDFPEIKQCELKFSPSFVKKAPSLVDRIKIKINKE
jgi:hypothetical protein